MRQVGQNWPPAPALVTSEGGFPYILFFIALLIRSLFVLVFFEVFVLRLALVSIIIVLFVELLAHSAANEAPDCRIVDQMFACWTVERLRRTVRRSAAKGIIEASLLDRARSQKGDDRLMRLVAGIKAAPAPTLAADRCPA
jgi:hypothetical protein